MTSMERPDFPKTQTDLLRNVPPESIAHGATVSLAVIQQFVPEGIVIGLGSGTGEKGQYPSPLAFTGIEVNEGAVEFALQQHHVVSLSGDARNFWANEINLAMIVYLERSAGVVIEALLANVISNTDIRSIFRTADIALRPGGYIFLAEPIRFDDPSIPESFWERSFEGGTFREWQERWLHRYKVNVQAGLPDGVFAVAKPGPDKEKLDWATTVEDVKRLLASDQLERFARHIRPAGLDMYLKHLQYSQQHFEPTMMLSRRGEPLVGMIAVYRKDYGLRGKRHKRVYRYMPWGFKGSTEDEMRRGIRHSRSTDLVHDLQRTMPQTQQPPTTFVLHS